jgi:uncharacterized membrane protein YtjA (UPF0391 family)
MLRYFLVFIAVAINAVVFGFSQIAARAGNIPKISFLVFLALFSVLVIATSTGARNAMQTLASEPVLRDRHD